MRRTDIGAMASNPPSASGLHCSYCLGFARRLPPAKIIPELVRTTTPQRRAAAGLGNIIRNRDGPLDLAEHNKGTYYLIVIMLTIIAVLDHHSS
ncbi:MAG: hypothetical protein QOH19_948 [Actinomycetota bacterium]|nr:hypothetical protein [Actinomycetota bacterium]